MAWQNLITPNYGTKETAGLCLVYAQSFLGAPVQYPSAHIAWLNQKGRHVGEMPPANIVPLWFDHWGTYGNPPTYGNWGHIVIYVPGDALYSSPEWGYGSARYETIAQVERAFNAKYVGWSEYLNGKQAVRWVDNAKPTATQRKTGANPVKRRAQATSKSAEIQPPLAANTIGNFDGWIRGEAVNDGIKNTNIWFRGNPSGNFFWAGGFTSQAVTGLKDLNPVKPPTPVVGQRTVAKNPVKRRESPSTKSKELQPPLKAGETGTFDAWTKGEQVFDGIKNTNIWFRGKASKNWFWAGGFTSQAVTGLTEIKQTEPVPKPDPVPTVKYQDPEIRNLEVKDIPAWIKFDIVEDAETKGYTAQKWNLELYDFYKSKGVDKQYRPAEFHAHWWDDPAKKPTHEGVVNHLKTTEGVTVNFVVSENRVTSMLPLQFMATTTGLRNPYGWKMEIDPSLTEGVYKTVGALLYIVEKATPRLKNEPVRLHKEFMQTTCSDIKVDKVREWANKFATGEYDISTGKKKEVVPTDSIKAVRIDLQKLVERLEKLEG